MSDWAGGYPQNLGDVVAWEASIALVQSSDFSHRFGRAPVAHNELALAQFGLPRDFLDFAARYDLNGVEFGQVNIGPRAEAGLAALLLKWNRPPGVYNVPEGFLAFAMIDGGTFSVARGCHGHDGAQIHYHDTYDGGHEVVAPDMETFVVLSASLHFACCEDRPAKDFLRQVREAYPHASPQTLEVWRHIGSITGVHDD